MKRIIITISILLNIVLALCLYIDNFTGTNIASYLERRGLYEIPDENRIEFGMIGAWANCLDKMELDSTIVFFGNSITAHSNFQKSFTDRKVINLGVSGSNTLEMCKRAFMVRYCNASKIFIMAGTNDLQRVSVDCFIDRFIRLINEIKDNSNAQIYVESILPFNKKLFSDSPDIEKINKANSFIKSVCERYSCTYIDLYSLYEKDGMLCEEFTTDGVHLNKENSYRLFESEIRKYIYE